jgi:hypothetical protein
VVGDAVGDVVGDCDGDAVGVAVGDCDGDNVGDSVGLVVGDAVGLVVGDAVGDVVGDCDGDEVGDVVGERVGPKVPAENRAIEHTHSFSNMSVNIIGSASMPMTTAWTVAVSICIGAKISDAVIILGLAPNVT